MSEPDALFTVKPDSFETQAEILGATVALQFMDLTNNNQIIFLKPRSEANFLMEEMSIGSPDTNLYSCIEMRSRQYSLYDMVESMPRVLVKMFLPKDALITIKVFLVCFQSCTLDESYRNSISQYGIGGILYSTVSRPHCSLPTCQEEGCRDSCRQVRKKMCFRIQSGKSRAFLWRHCRRRGPEAMSESPEQAFTGRIHH